MRTTPPRTGLTPNVSVLPRPWSSPLPVRRARYRGLRGFFVGLAVGGAFVGLAAAGFAEGGFTNAAPVVAPVSAAVASAAGCSFRIEPETHRELVVDTEVKGRIVVWHKGREWRSFVAPAHDVEYFNLKRRHRNVAHFRVAVVAVGRQHDDEQVTWCKPIG